LQNAKLLEELHLTIGLGPSLLKPLSLCACTLKILDLSVRVPLTGVYEGLEEMAGHNMLEALSIVFHVDGHGTEDLIGSTIQNVEGVLVKPGWSALSHISFDVSIACCLADWHLAVWHQWPGSTVTSCPRRYNLYPMNISSTFQNSSLLLLTIQLTSRL
jgi:hypothetical protein